MPDQDLPDTLVDAPEFVSRGGLKLHHAVVELRIPIEGKLCADLGCSTGGFTDCLLHNGASHVHAVDTAYGEFAWKLRTDERVTIHERTNAIHADVPERVVEDGGIDLVVIDLGWTRQSRALPAAMRWLRDGGQIVSLVKPHYEAEQSELGEHGVLDPERAEQIAQRVRTQIPEMGLRELGWTKSPVIGGAVGKRKKRKGKGNPEWLIWLTNKV
jgi:23S rRNA (cytidine1920-2'-O)/16S rRNA (cytidine1409-2'-O)-methyltransferase